MTDQSITKTLGQKQAEWADRRAEALNYRIQGLSYEAIGALMGISKQSAWELVQKSLEATVREPSNVVRELERQRLDAALVAVQGRIDARRPDESVDKAIDGMLKIMARRAKLDGLDVETAAPIVAIQAVAESVDTSRFSPDELRSWFELQAKGAKDDATRERYEAAARALGPASEGEEP